MTQTLQNAKKPIIFTEKQVSITPPIFEGVTLKSFLHPDPQYNDGFSSFEQGLPEVRYSFGLFVIEKNKQWPLTRFSVSEVNYILEGAAIFEVEGTSYPLHPGDVIYIPPQQARSIRVVGDKDLKFLSIVDPAWLPQYEEVL